MSTFKCKMCGGTLEIQSGSTVAECEYCGAKQTLPKLDDEKRANLYDRANHFRRSNEFDKASAIYEQILAEDNTDAEAYWSLVLCRYGIEYVEDPLSHRRVPTVHRAQFTSIFDDDNYKSALKNSDTYQRVIYEEEAKAINEIQKGILAISQKEEPFDVFICYKETDDSGKRTHDSVLAQDLYYQLKQEGFKVFFARITLEDKLGSAYEPYIFAALNSAKVMVVLGTKPEYFNAVWVKNEWSRFLSLIKKGEKKMLIPAYKDMDPYNLPKEFSHLQAQDMSKLGFMQDLIRGIKKILGRDKKPAAPTVERVVVQGDGHAQDAAPLLRRAFLFLEDGEFDNADEYAEKVLDINPECAEAYVVKLLIELRLKKPSDLAQCKNPISDSHNYQKAIRFASPEYRETIEGYNNAIIKRIDTARKDEVYARGVELMRLHRYDEAVQYFQKIPTYKDSTQKIDDCKKLKETERRDGIYDRATQLLNAGQFDEAARLFESIEDHKDSKEKIKLCGERKETARKDAIYSQAMNRVRPQNADDAAIKKSIEELQTISGYRDVDGQIRALNARLEKWYEDKKKTEEAARIKAEEDRRTREREAELRRIKAEKTKKTVKKVAKIGIPSVIALATLLILLFTLVIPLIRYNTADKLFNEGKYDEAMAIYKDIGGFSDSEQRITVLTGIDNIDNAKFEDGIKKILSAGVPVKLTYGMSGGDFSGATYLSASQESDNGGIALLSASNTSNVTPLAATTASVPETVEYTYNSSADFSGIQTPGRSGYRFVEWTLETYSYQIDGTFEMKLNAVWSEKEYTISYDLNDGKVATNNPVEYGIEDETFTLVNPTKTGYTFIGWTGTGLDGLTMSVTIEKGSVGNRSYEANWQANTYTITLNPNGGSVSPTSKTVTYDASYTLPTPTRTGYTFAGWYSGNIKYTGGTWKTASNLTLKAHWTANSYTVTYDDTAETRANVIVTFNYNYSGSTSSTVTLTNGQRLNYPTNPTRSGYVFAGWYTNSSCTTAYNFSGTITADMTLYASWKTCTITNNSTYSWSSSSGVLTSTNKGNSSSSTYKITATMPVTISFSYKTSSESGYDFLYIKKNGSQLKSCSGSTSYVSYSVTLNTGDYLEFIYSKDSSSSSGSDCAYIKDITYTSNVSYTSTATASCSTVTGYVYDTSSSVSTTVTFGSSHTLPTLTRTGYSFLGWYNGNTKVESGNWSIASNVTLTPRWQAGGNTITLNANGGTVSTNSIAVTYDQAYTLPTPTRIGYTFAGWYNGTTQYTSGTWTRTADLDLTAKWDIVTYNISYTMNGGTTPTANPSTYNVNSSITLAQPTKTGYTFKGWTGTGLSSPTMTVVIDDCTGNRSYTATWEANTYTITLNANGGSVSPTSKTVDYGATYTLPTPTRTGYTFAGWYSGSTQYTGGTWTRTSDLALTAKWTTNGYTITYDDVEELKTTVTVTFNYNYSGSTSSTVTLSNGQTLSYPTVPTRSGYAFAGWYTNSSCTTAYVFSGTLTADTTLYAKWVSMTSSYSTREYVDIKNYNSSSSKKSVTISASSSSSPNYYYFTCYKAGTYNFYSAYSTGDFYITVYNATKGSYILERTNLYSNNASKSTSFTADAGDVIYVSLYKYSSSGSTGSGTFYVTGAAYPTSTATASTPAGGFEYKNNSTYIDSVDYGANYTLPVPTRTGYTFGGWYNGSTKVENGAWNIASNVTLTAKWTANTYTVNFNANGGTVSPTSKTATYDSSFTLPTPTWAGHTFSGWYNGSTKVTSGTWKYTTGMTLTAHWDAVNYTVSYTLNGGTNGANPSTYTVNDSFTLKEPTKTGYTFTGWTYSGQTTPTKNVTISVGTMGNLSYTANWQVNSYTVTLDANGGSVSPTSKTVTYDASYTLPTPTRTGYTFAGWYSGGTKYTGGTWKTASNTTLTASWTANSGIAYVVNHHKQNIAGTGWEAPEVQNLTGTAGASITPSVKSYTGFTAPVTQTVTVAPDGSLVVDYYYTRNSYTITMVTNGGNTITAITQKYQSALTMPNATRTGYTFGGWFTNVDLTTSFTETTMPTSNTTVYAYWTEENKPSEFTYSGSSEITISGYKGTDTTVVVPSYIGGKSVTKLASDAFANETTLTKITVPNTVTTIGEGVFAGCTALQELVLPFIGSSQYAELPYTTQNSTSYPWSVNSSGVLTSTNHGHSSSSEFKLVATMNTSLTFEYKTESEGTHDKLTILKNGTELVSTAGTPSYVSYTVQLNAGDVLIFRYSKDGSVSNGSDCAYIKGLAIYTETYVLGYFFGTSSAQGTTEVVQDEVTYYIPSSLRKVTSNTAGIANSAFENCTMLEEINIANADAIGASAFKNCTSLKRLNSTTDGVFVLPNGVISISNYAFYGCTQIAEVVTGESVANIGDYAFSGCTALSKFNSENANTIVIPEGVLSIGTQAFMNVSGVTNIIVADSVTTIGSGAFRGCNSLVSITLPFVGKMETETTGRWAVLGYIFGDTTPEDTTMDSSTTIYRTSGTEGLTSQYVNSGSSWFYFAIPQSLRTVTITKQANIPAYAFYNCDLIETINLPSNVESIGNYTFYNCSALNRMNSSNANTLNMPTGLLTIGNYAFANVSTVKTVIVPETVTSIGTAAFKGCNVIESLTLPFIGLNATTTGSENSVLGYLFGNNGTTEAEGTTKQYYQSSTSYYRYYFIPTTIKEVTITNQATIPFGAFSGCTFIENITIEGATTISAYTFYGCTALETVALNDEITSIGSSAFYNCSALKSINSTTAGTFNLPTATTKINSSAFYNCSLLTTLNCGDAVATIGDYAFKNCVALVYADIGTGVTTIGTQAFYGTILNRVNSTTANTINLPTGLLTIGANAFEGLSTIKTVIVPETVTQIGEAAFKGCNAITDITLPFVGYNNTANDGAAYVFGYIFGTSSSSTGTIYQYHTYCLIPTTIRNVTITVQTRIPTYAFYNCTFIESITIPENTTSIRASAFRNCNALSYFNSAIEGVMNIPDTVTSIGDLAFYKCLEITTLNIGEATKSIGSETFRGNVSLATVTFGTSLESIGSYAFEGCVSLNKVGSNNANTIDIPTGVKTIGSYAFQNANSIKTIIVPDTVTTISEGAFKDCASVTSITLPFIGYQASTSSGTSYVFGYIFGTSSSSTGTTNQYHTYYCIPTSIKNVTITTQTAFPAYAFYNCSFIENITIPEDTTTIGSYAFYNCLGLKRLNSSKDGEFNIPKAVSTINKYTFYKCLLLEEITYGDITSVGEYAFNGAVSLKEIVLPDSTTSIGSYSFAGCVALEKFSFGTGLRTIGYHAFDACAMLSKINTTANNTAIIPETVTKIEDGAFKGCTEIYNWTLPFIGNTESATSTSAVFGYIFGYTSTSSSVAGTINQGSSTSYKYYVPTTIKSVTITKQTVIPDYAFHNCTFIETINIPNSTTEIGDYAFKNCTVLKRVNSTVDGVLTIPTMTSVIYTYAFENCKAITEINGGENLVTISAYAFYNCSNLSKVTLGTELATIGNYAFANCNSLNQVNSSNATTINLLYGVSTIGDYAFQNAKLITDIVVPVTTNKIGHGAFNGCSAVVNITIPFVGTTVSATDTSSTFGYIFGYTNTSSSVSGTINQGSSTKYKYYVPTTIRTINVTAQATIPAYAFQNCSFIETINLVNGATTTAEKAFENCSATINKTVTPVIAPSWNGTDVATGFESGTGTQEDPYVIFSGAQLAYLAQQVNAGVSYENTYFILSADIVLGNKAFSIIGTDADHAFKGIIDGKNHVIRDFTITSDALAVGLFGYFDGTLKNLGIENCTIKATRTTSGPVYVGLIAYSTGTIENCYTRATVTASCGYTVYAGGMVGYNLGTIKNSYASGNVTATSTNFNAVAGGFVAHNEGTVNNCVAYGNVSATGYTETYSLSGGFVAENEGTLTNCYRYAEQTVKHYNKVGGTNEEGTEATLSELSTYYASNWSATAWNFATIYPKFK